MKVKLGLVGPADSLERIARASEGFRDAVELVPRVYRVKEESVALAKELDPAVDVILFSGVIPYKIVALSNATTKPLLYLPRAGMSLARPLWEMRERHEPFSRISIDSFAYRDVAEVAEELGVSFESVVPVEYEESTSYEDLARAHETLYRGGEVDVALTGLSRTVELLKARGVPCHRIFPTKYIIREYVEKAVYVAQNERLRSYQLSVAILRLGLCKAAAPTEYDYLKRRNAFERVLIDCAKGLLGSVFPSGHNEYLLFATRGTIDGSDWLDALAKSADEAGIQYSVGLGYGVTAYGAEANARMALERAAAAAGSCAFAVDENGEIQGPLRSSSSLTYALSGDAGLMELAEKTGLSPAHLSRIRSMLRAGRSNRVGVDELAAALGVGPRSARRILRSLADAGKAEVAALESRSVSGRPRTLYDVHI